MSTNKMMTITNTVTIKTHLKANRTSTGDTSFLEYFQNGSALFSPKQKEQSSLGHRILRSPSETWRKISRFPETGELLHCTTIRKYLKTLFDHFRSAFLHFALLLVLVLIVTHDTMIERYQSGITRLSILFFIDERNRVHASLSINICDHSYHLALYRLDGRD